MSIQYKSLLQDDHDDDDDPILYEFHELTKEELKEFEIYYFSDKPFSSPKTWCYYPFIYYSIHFSKPSMKFPVYVASPIQHQMCSQVIIMPCEETPSVKLDNSTLYIGCNVDKTFCFRNEGIVKIIKPNKLFFSREPFWYYKNKEVTSFQFVYIISNSIISDKSFKPICAGLWRPASLCIIMDCSQNYFFSFPFISNSERIS
jgi:hypothetical protein